MGLIKHKNYWRKNGRYERLAEGIESGLPRQIKEPLYREDTGIAHTRAKIIKQGRKIGKCGNYSL